MKCPSCNGALVAKIFEGVDYHQCSNCEGAWVQKNRVGALFSEYLDHIQVEDAQGKKGKFPIRTWEVTEPLRLCPECGNEMRKVNYAYDSNVIIDKCKVCQGIWLDKGEMHKIAVYLKGNPEAHALAELYATSKPFSTGGGTGAEYRENGLLANIFDVIFMFLSFLGRG